MALHFMDTDIIKMSVSLLAMKKILGKPACLSSKEIPTKTLSESFVSSSLGFLKKSDDKKMAGYHELSLKNFLSKSSSKLVLGFIYI